MERTNLKNKVVCAKCAQTNALHLHQNHKQNRRGDGGIEGQEDVAVVGVAASVEVFAIPGQDGI